MYELLLNSPRSESVPTTYNLRVIPSTSARTLVMTFRRVIGTVTYDVPGSFVINAANTGVTHNVPVPADATLMIFDIAINPVGTAVPQGATTGTNTIIQAVESWGTTMAGDVNIHLLGSTELIAVPDYAPPWSNWSNLLNGCSKFNQNLEGWSTGHVTAMNIAFRNCTVFNGSIGTWNTANVVSMAGMFNGCFAFNKNINGWNVGNVTTMGTMFQDATAFNQNLSNLTFPKVTAVNRSNYDLRASSWQANFKPTFALN